MISTVRLWETVMQSAKTGTSGYQSASEFNRDLKSVQTSLMGLLAPKYAVNTMVQELLAPFVRSLAIADTKPPDCFYFLGGTINGITANPILPTQDSLYRTSPIRRPSAQNETAYYYLVNDNIQWVYYGAFAGHMEYIKAAPECNIILTPISEANRDYVVPTADRDLDWPESAFNFLLGMLQMKLGIELKEDLQMQMGQLGIQTETAKAEV